VVDRQYQDLSDKVSWTQSLRGAHRGRVCVHSWGGCMCVYASVYIYIVFRTKKKCHKWIREFFLRAKSPSIPLRPMSLSQIKVSRCKTGPNPDGPIRIPSTRSRQNWQILYIDLVGVYGSPHILPEHGPGPYITLGFPFNCSFFILKRIYENFQI
jgi:hypothetical protein